MSKHLERKVRENDFEGQSGHVHYGAKFDWLRANALCLTVTPYSVTLTNVLL